MSLLDEFETAPASAKDRSPPAVRAKRGGAIALFVGASVFAGLAALFAAGHPILAVWIALALIGWLFIAGAAEASADRRPSSSKRRLPRSAGVASRRNAV